MTRSFSSNLRGKVRNFALPKNRPLVPLYEAVVNSINAIEERAAKQGVFKGKEANYYHVIQALTI